jgi:hypothetical protein
MNPKCPKCEMEMVEVDRTDSCQCFACADCDMPGEPQWKPHYQKSCWNCGSDIDSDTCKHSSIPGMGYVCNTCGKDLVEWHLMKGNITNYELAKVLQKNQWRVHAVL